MTINHTSESTFRKPIRLWPGVIAVVLQWLFWIVVPIIPMFGPDAGYFGLMGGVLCGLLAIVWWLFFSRAPWMERLGVIVLVVAGLVLTKRIVHASIAGGMMGMMIYVYAIPVMCVALVAGLLASRSASARRRRVALATAILLGCGVFTLIRTDGILGAKSQIAWRWSKTAEERLLT